MSKEAIEYKSLHKDINFENLSLAELNKLPSHNGVYDFKISKTSFLMLNIINDDSSVVKHFWKGSHDLEELDLWFEISKNEGVFIDVGAHTGLYTITSLKANPKNNVFCFEPYFMNLSRLITNLRLNGIFKNVSSVLGAVNFLKSNSYKIYNIKDLNNEFNFEENKIENVINLYAKL